MKDSCEKLAGQRDSSLRSEIKKNQLPEAVVAMTAVAGALFCCWGLWPMTLRMAMMATYPQAIPKASENKIVNRTVVEANNVLIVQSVQMIIVSTRLVCRGN